MNVYKITLKRFIASRICGNLNQKKEDLKHLRKFEPPREVQTGKSRALEYAKYGFAPVFNTKM